MAACTSAHAPCACVRPSLQVPYVAVFVLHAVKLGTKAPRGAEQRRLSIQFVEALVEGGLLQVGGGCPAA